MAVTPVYLLLLRTGPGWQAGKPIAEQGLGPHVDYVRGLLADGRLIAGGPWAGDDADGGLVLVRAGSLEEAQAMLEADPAVAGGLFTGEVRAWLPIFDSGRSIRP